MAAVIFIFNGKKTSILCKKDDKMKVICCNFASRIGININSLYFYYEEKPLNFELTFNEQANLIDINRNGMNIFALDNKKLFQSEEKKVEKINLDIELSNKIKIKYKKNINQSELKIFGKYFVEENKENCKIIYEYKFYELNEYLNISNCDKNLGIVEVELTGINNITNMAFMFYDCESLLSFQDISNWNTINVIDMSWMFYNCNSLISLPDISKWKTNNVTDMSFMFYNCKLLFSIPDISIWNIMKVTNLSRMFYNCESLISLPDISKWNTINVKNMSSMFSYCKSLLALPDISKWNTKNVNDMSCMFYNCKSLKNLPNINKWNTNNVANNKNMFFGCNDNLNIPLK